MSSNSSDSSQQPSSASSSSSSTNSRNSGRHPLSGPDRSLDRCHALGQASLKCQNDAQLRLNHQTQTKAVLAICKQQIDDYLVCFRREQEKRK